MELEQAGGGGPQGQAHDRVDDTPVTDHQHRLTRRGVQGAAQCGTDAQLELGDRLAAREGHRVRIALPVGGAVAADELLERHAVAVGTRIVLAEPLDHLDGAPEHPFEHLGGLDRPGIPGRDQPIDPRRPIAFEPVAQRLGLSTTQLRQAVAGPRTAHDPTDGDVRLAVSDQQHPGRRGRCGIGRHARQATQHRAAELFVRTCANEGAGSVGSGTWEGSTA